MKFPAGHFSSRPQVTQLDVRVTAWPAVSIQYGKAYPDTQSLCKVGRFPKLIVMNVVLQEYNVWMLISTVRSFAKLEIAIHHVLARSTGRFVKVDNNKCIS